ncbi:hypothetical protein D3C79_765920 [compost metagenome]
MVDTLVAQHPVRGTDVLSHLQDRQQVLQLAVTRRVIAEHRQCVVMVGNRIAQVLR